MKTLFFAYLVSFSALASNWMPVSKVDLGYTQAFQLQKDCENRSSEKCVDVGNNPALVSEGVITVSQTWSAKTQVAACSGQASCEEQLASLYCSVGQPFISEDYTETYCSELLISLNTDETKLSQIQAAEAAKAQLAALESAGLKAKSDCDRVLNLIRGFNLLPGRTVEQTTQMQTVFADIQKALQDGRPGVAKALIQAAQPDGTIVTEAMKTAALNILKDW